MTRQVRRVVTGHDANGRAGVKIEEVEKRYRKLFKLPERSFSEHS